MEQIKFDELKIVAKLDVPAGKRLCRIINKGKDSVSLGGFVPQLSQEQITELFASPVVNEFLIGQIHGVQDKIVRGSLENGMLDTASLSPELIISFLTEEREESIRLSKDKIESWFNTELAPVLRTALVAKGLKQEDQIKETIAVFKASFSSLAAREVNMKENIKKQLEKALALLPDSAEENPITEKIATKLATAKESKVELDAL